MYILISEKIIARVLVSLLTIVSGLVLISLAATNPDSLPEPLGKLFAKLNQLSDDTQMLDINSEEGIANWFSSTTLLFCSLLLASIASFKRVACDRYATLWAILPLVFLYMSFDEAFGIHEKAILPLRSALGTGGFFYFAWVIPGMALVIVFGLVYLRFFLDLPTKTRRLFAASATLYVGGALGVEFIEGFVYELEGFSTTYGVLTHVQEGLEMLGIVIFVYALMRYTADELEEMRSRGFDSARGTQ